MTKLDRHGVGAKPEVVVKGKERIGRAAVRLVGQAMGGGETRKTKKAKSGRGDDVRERVLRAALECFGAFGFEGTSTRAVAERASVGHTLVIYHFQSKDKLWIATVENALKGYVSGVTSGLKASGSQDAREVLETFIENFVKLSAEQPQIHRILTMESNQGTERLEWVIDHFLRSHFTMVTDLIRRGQAEGAVRQCDPARLYYHIIGSAGTPFTISTEYKALTGRDVFSKAEILRIIAFIHEFVFI